MAIIVNKSEFCLSINPKGKPSFTVPPLGKSARIPDEDAKEWADRSERLIKAGVCYVRFDANDPTVPRDEDGKVEPPPDLPPETNDPEAVASFGEMHWRKAVSTVEGITDPDLLADIHAAEQRPRVRQALEARMKELSTPTEDKAS